jgi:lysophospholipase L1-like esterase
MLKAVWILIISIFLFSCSGSSSNGGGLANQNIVMAGDSLTYGNEWKSFSKCGGPGMGSSGLLACIESCVSSRPDKIFIMIGVNNVLAHVLGVVGDISMIIEKIKTLSPKTTIYLQSILPIIGNNYEIERINSQLPAICNGVVWINLYPLFSGHPEYYDSTGVHLTEIGYQVWRDAIRIYL